MTYRRIAYGRCLIRRVVSLLLAGGLLLGMTRLAVAQEKVFDLGDFQTFLDTYAGLPTGDLLAMHPAGTFQRRAGTSFRAAQYSDSVQVKYAVTPHEADLLDRHGFVVTERLSFDAFGSAFLDVYTKDLPVFISTDAILHALHMSYDRILMDTEEGVLIPKLDALLAALQAAVPTLADRYAGVPGMEQPLRDLDVYLTVPRRLLAGAPVPPVFAENEGEVQALLGLVAEEEGFKPYPLFAENCRLLDFSQFTPRGHYTQSEELTRYFQAMIWLGRTELYLSAPATDACSPSEADVQRQTILAMLVTEAVEAGPGAALLAEVEALIQLFVGESDNVTLPHLQTLRTLTGTAQAADLLDVDRFHAFQETLLAQAWSMQRIQSQILVSLAPMQPGRLQPASAFLLLGQRFVIDSYVTGSVVFDKINYEGGAVKRMLPDPLDVLFALGNDAAAQLLAPELDVYHYAPNLAALRYLVDSYEGDFWQHTLYNGWLNAIRTLSPPAEADRASLPPFMRTAAWWQEKMNTQLASWAQLRHDNLLYAKQSYTGVPGCSYPYSYVEPIPAFYEAVSTFAHTAADRFRTVEQEGGLDVDRIQAYFENLSAVNDTLAVIARKELDGTPFNEAEQRFLQRVIFERLKACYVGLDGWYARLFYGDEEGAQDPDMVVADIHTAPADAGGGIVGWVLHVGTGPINMAVVTAEVPGEGPITFVGPVMSYYEHLSTGFERLTDEVWETAYAAAPSYRPDFVNLYLADGNGEPRGEPAMLTVGVERAPGAEPQAGAPALMHNYPNPFREATSITFSIPPSYAHQHVELAVYDIQGRRIEQLVDEPLPAGHYTVRWEGLLGTGARAASGVYFCRLRIGDRQMTVPMARLR